MRFGVLFKILSETSFLNYQFTVRNLVILYNTQCKCEDKQQHTGI